MSWVEALVMSKVSIETRKTFGACFSSFRLRLWRARLENVRISRLACDFQNAFSLGFLMIDGLV